MICCFHMVSIYIFIHKNAFYIEKYEILFHKNVNILYHMKTLGLNAHMEGWWEKRQTKEETTHG